MRRAAPQANNFARPGSPFFPLENENIKGNPNLVPEEAETWTFGVVLNGPGNLDNLMASFDIYNVEIAEAIAPLDSVFVYRSASTQRHEQPDVLVGRSGRLLQAHHA